MRLKRRDFLKSTLVSASLAAAPVFAFAETKLSVVATTGMIADAARQVGGDLVNVKIGDTVMMKYTALHLIVIELRSCP